MRPARLLLALATLGLGLGGGCGDPPSSPADDDQEEPSCGAIGCGSLEPRLVALPALVDETALATAAWLDTLEARCRAVVDGLGGTIEGGPVDEPLVARVERTCIAARMVLLAADLDLVTMGDGWMGYSPPASLAAFDACLDLCSCPECPFTEPRCGSPNPDAGTCTGRCVGWCASHEEPVACEGSCDGTCTGRCVPEPGSAPPTEGVEVDGVRCPEICSGTCEGSCKHESFHDLACEGTCAGACVGGTMQDPLCGQPEVEDLGACGCASMCGSLARVLGPGVGPWAYDASGAVSDDLATTIIDLAQVCARGGDLEQLLVHQRFSAQEMDAVGARVTSRCATELLATIESEIAAITAARTACAGIPPEVPSSW